MKSYVEYCQKQWLGKVRGFKVFNNREEAIGFNELSSIPKKL